MLLESKKRHITRKVGGWGEEEGEDRKREKARETEPQKEARWTV